MTLEDWADAVSLKKTAGFHVDVKIGFDWKSGHWKFCHDLFLYYSKGDDLTRKIFPNFEGPTILECARKVVAFLNDGPLTFYTPTNSYGIDGSYELREKVELGGLRP